MSWIEMTKLFVYFIWYTSKTQLNFVVFCEDTWDFRWNQLENSVFNNPSSTQCMVHALSGIMCLPLQQMDKLQGVVCFFLSPVFLVLAWFLVRTHCLTSCEEHHLVCHISLSALGRNDSHIPHTLAAFLKAICQPTHLFPLLGKTLAPQWNAQKPTTKVFWFVLLLIRGNWRSLHSC